ncbi:phage integrase SAM-like domain-containing protein, partial [bacterium]|nr:phage integrase SAM-like domain-containing protein [bacterium]
MSSNAAVEQKILDDTFHIDNYLDDCKLRGMSSDSIQKYRSPLFIFLRFLSGQGTRLDNVDNDVLKVFIGYLQDERRVSQRTIEYYFSTLSSLYEYLEFEGYVPKNPVLAVRKRYLRHYKDTKGSNSTRQLISIEEMKMLISSILDARDKAILTLLAKTG